MEVLFSLIFLLTAYFLGALGVVQGFIPWKKRIMSSSRMQFIKLDVLAKAMAISFLIASGISAIMFYFFVYPSYQIL